MLFGTGNPANCIVLAADKQRARLAARQRGAEWSENTVRSNRGGEIHHRSGETKDLDIDFNACASIVVTGNGQFTLKPVLHAGEVGTSSAINGTVIDSTTGIPVVGGTTVVALEQKDANGVDRVLLSILADSSGNFVLCPVPTGSYDLVVAAVNGAGVFYAATVTTGVQDSTTVGNIPVTPEPGTNSTGPASLTGVVQTGGSSGAVSEIVTLSSLQMVSLSGSGVQVTIPLVEQSVATANVRTISGSCQNGFDCVNFTLAVPGVNAFAGAFSGSGTQYTQASGSVSYQVDGQPVNHADGTRFAVKLMQRAAPSR